MEKRNVNDKAVTTPSLSFSDLKIVSEYAEKTVRLVPGLSDLHRMAAYSSQKKRQQMDASWY